MGLAKGTNLEAALVNLETGVPSWVFRCKNDVLSLQLKQPLLRGMQELGKQPLLRSCRLVFAQGKVPNSFVGAKERGELEGHVNELTMDVKKSGIVIFFIDEVHTVIGSGTIGRGNKGSGLDIANLLKLSLGRGELLCIASTTMDEYKTHFEKDKALAPRFQPVLINEPSQFLEEARKNASKDNYDDTTQYAEEPQNRQSDEVNKKRKSGLP